MNHYNDSISFTNSYEDINFLNEYQNQDETKQDLNPDPFINFYNFSSYGNRNIEDDELHLDSHFDFDITPLFGTKETFKVELTSTCKSEKDINNIIHSKNLNKEIKEKLYLDESISSKEIKQIWSELLFPKKRRRDKRKENVLLKI